MHGLADFKSSKISHVLAYIWTNCEILLFEKYVDQTVFWAVSRKNVAYWIKAIQIANLLQNSRMLITLHDKYYICNLEKIY
jgi:hypothetical protein